MSAAVYYANPNMPVDYDHSKHTLPSLSQIVPMGQQQQQQQQQNHVQSIDHSGSPVLMGANMVPVNNNISFPSSQSTPDVLSSQSQTSSNSTTPASSFNLQPTWTQGQVTEKCTCKSNQNRIPRPRNAFILFRQKYHQSVLDEGSVIRTNPEVSRELGRRWRSLSKEDKEHWNNLAEEEKQNHAKKYPGYRYAPRRNGKSKSCPGCHQRLLRQQQAQLHNSQMIQLQQEQFQQYLQIHQQHQQQQTNVPSGSNYINQPAGQYLISNPYIQQVQMAPQHNFQYSFNNDLNASVQQHPQDRLSPLSMPTQFPAGVNQEFASQPVNQQQYPINYDLSNHATQTSHVPMVTAQRFNSLPTPVSGSGSIYGFDNSSSSTQLQ